MLRIGYESDTEFVFIGDKIENTQLYLRETDLPTSLMWCMYSSFRWPLKKHTSEILN